jgi:hypothetical protein
MTASNRKLVFAGAEIDVARRDAPTAKKFAPPPHEPSVSPSDNSACYNLAFLSITIVCGLSERIANIRRAALVSSMYRPRSPMKGPSICFVNMHEEIGLPRASNR